MSEYRKNQQVGEDEIDLLKLFFAILSKWKWIVATTLAGAIIAGSISYFLIAPTYKATALLYVNSNQQSSGQGSISYTEINASKSLVNTYIVILKSRSTLDDVIRKTNVEYTVDELSGMISASAVNSTEIFQVAVTSTNPEEAKLIANTIAAVLPSRISEVISGSSVSVVSSAVTPNKKAGPNNAKNAIIGAVVGFALSCGIVIVAFLLDDEIHSEEDLTENYDVPVLAVIPDLKEKGSGSYKEAKFEVGE